MPQPIAFQPCRASLRKEVHRAGRTVLETGAEEEVRGHIKDDCVKSRYSCLLQAYLVVHKVHGAVLLGCCGRTPVENH